VDRLSEGLGSAGGGGDINISLYGVTINSKENIRELAEELGFELRFNLMKKKRLSKGEKTIE
jgi:hypothetical protein